MLGGNTSWHLSIGKNPLNIVYQCELDVTLVTAGNFLLPLLFNCVEVLLERSGSPALADVEDRLSRSSFVSGVDRVSASQSMQLPGNGGRSHAGDGRNDVRAGDPVAGA